MPVIASSKKAFGNDEIDITKEKSENGKNKNEDLGIKLVQVSYI